MSGNGMTGANADMAGSAFADAVRQALTPHATAYDGPADRALAWSDVHWQAVTALGLPKLLVPEAQGGAGAALAEGAAAIEALGALGDPSPAADTAVLSWLLARQGAEAPDGPLVPAEPGCRVPWPEDARAVDPAGNAAAPPDGQGGILLNGVPASPALPGAIDEFTPLRQAMAAARAVQIAGAAGAALEMTADYVRERRQFGRPLARFQAVQQHIAVAAAEVAAAAQMARAAFAALDRELDGDGPFLAAAAKVATGRAGTLAAKAAHQFHGAMGYTAEYPLHRLTRAIWQWREDCGNEDWWSRRLGAQVCRAGADALWPTLAGG
ncbi:MAG: hypothetical protein F4114_04430 [Rhodospirillaceae bacterium]|nr:hypothetical protein [Rhodospirillaceae bacterium]MYB14313.1 hypothetical protein [Rhodospirillaceae bacterium]MYI48319.1 hypothetical protein [Rhodospirillaceae bacterium]